MMKIISCLLALVGLVCIAFSILMKLKGINLLGAGAPVSYLVLANTFFLLSISAAMHKK
ncbi:MAG: hypothetical protein WBD24_00550 [Candidatus Omnitrophota bacterium]